MNGFNLSNISDLYVGSAKASAIYKGSTLIWEADPQINEYFWLMSPNGASLNLESTSSGPSITIDCSTDKINWSSITISSGGTTNITLNRNQKNYFRGNNSAYATSGSNYFHFSCSGTTHVGGNIMSLIYGDNFKGQTTISSTYAFNGLFKSAGYLTDASNLRLPATTITSYCYQNMFSGCSNLIAIPPVLPASWARYFSYYGMFSGCMHLNEVPDMTALTKLDGYALSFMFSGCTSLTKIPDFSNVNTITYWAPWRYTFSGCNAITDARYNVNNKRTLPTSLTVTSGGSAYEQMFNGCTNLVYAPELTETNPHAGEYNNMFNGCTSLYNIYTHATSLGTNYFVDIVKNTGHQGTIYKANDVTWDSSNYSQFNYNSSSRWNITNGSYTSGDYQT